jgi:hypothetical protein
LRAICLQPVTYAHDTNSYHTTARGDRRGAAYIEGLSRTDQAIIAVALTGVAERGREARGVTLRQFGGKL